MSHAYKHNTYWYVLWLLLDIMFSILVPILCVHVSLWTYIFMIGVYLETYTHENRYILSWYSNSFMTTTFYCFWFFFNLLYECSFSRIASSCTHILWSLFAHLSFFDNFQMCFFTLSLGTSFAFHLASSLHLNKLVDLFYLYSLVCVYGKDMISTMCHIYWKTILMLAHLGFSLLKCLSHTHLSSVEQVFICRSLSLLLNHLLVTSLCLLC